MCLALWKCLFPLIKTGKKNAYFDFWLSTLVTFCNNITDLNLAKATAFNWALYNLSLIFWSTPKGKAAGLGVDVESTSQNSFSLLQKRGCCHFSSCDSTWQPGRTSNANCRAGKAEGGGEATPSEMMLPWAVGCLWLSFFYYFVPGQTATEELTGGCCTNRAASCIGVLCNTMPSQEMDQYHSGKGKESKEISHRMWRVKREKRIEEEWRKFPPLLQN